MKGRGRKDRWMDRWMDGWTDEGEGAERGIDGCESGGRRERLQRRVVGWAGGGNRVDSGLSSVRTYARVRTCAHRHTFFKVYMYRLLYIMLIIDFFVFFCWLLVAFK